MTDTMVERTPAKGAKRDGAETADAAVATPDETNRAVDTAQLEPVDGKLVPAAARLETATPEEDASPDADAEADADADADAVASPGSAASPESAEPDATAAPATPAATVSPEPPVAALTDNPDLRVILTRWSTSTDSPYAKVLVKNLGSRVEIGDVVRTPVAAIEYAVRSIEIRRTAFELPAPDGPKGKPLAPSFDLALPLLPPFEPSGDELEAAEAFEHLAWCEARPCPECEEGELDCERCAGDGQATCECGSGLVEQTVEEIVECPGCSGTGKTAPRVCIPCDGRGTIQCSTCWGTGKRPDKRPCDRCQTGTVTCGHCEGTGQVQGRCLKCTGPGVLPMQVVHEVPCPVCDGTAKVPCAACESSGAQSCERCKGSGSMVRGEIVRRVAKAGEIRRLSSNLSMLAVPVDPLAKATPFVASTIEAVQAVAAQIEDAPSVGEAFLSAAGEVLSDRCSIAGRFGSAAIVTFTARLEGWRGEFAVVESGGERSIESLSGARPPVDPKIYNRWVGKENAARTAAYEEAAAAAEGIYVAALAQYRQEVAAASARPAEKTPLTAADSGLAWERIPEVTPAGQGGADAVAPSAAAASEPIRIKWSSDAEEPAEEPAEPPKEKRPRFGLRGLVRGRRRDAEPQPDTAAGEPVRDDESASPADAIPAPVRREVPAPELLPAYAELPAEVRIA